jgi:CheY-like chemotaxis protein
LPIDPLGEPARVSTERAQNRVGYLGEQLDADIYLIPIRLEECEVPDRLSEFQYLDLFEDGAGEKLLMAIQEGMKRREVAVSLAPNLAASSSSSSVVFRNTFPQQAATTLGQGLEANLRVVCADDSDITRQGLANILDTQSDMSVVSSIGELEHVAEAVVQHHAQLLVLDLKWGQDFRAGLDIIPTVKRAAPWTKILAITAYDRLAPEAVAAGVDAAVGKDIPRQKLLEKIRNLAQGVTHT